MAQGLQLLSIPNSGSEHAFRDHYLPPGEKQRLPQRIPLSTLKVGPEAGGCCVMQRGRVDLASGSQVTGGLCSLSRLFPLQLVGTKLWSANAPQIPRPW